MIEGRAFASPGAFEDRPATRGGSSIDAAVAPGLCRLLPALRPRARSPTRILVGGADRSRTLIGEPRASYWRPASFWAGLQSPLPHWRGRNSGSQRATGATGVARYEYVVGVGRLSVYDITKRSLVGRFGLPGVAEIRGIGASAATGMLYVSYGGFPNGIGHLLEFSLYRRKIMYDRGYRFGIDSFDISHDGRLIFMPTGENTSGNTWHVLAATTGRVVGAIAAGRSPHDTVVDASGRHVFLGGASDRYLYEADAERPWKVVGRMGPLMPGGVAGVRPFTVDSQDRFAFTTANRYLGFQISDVATGRVLYTVPVPGFSVPPTFRGIPSHGIGLSPDQRYLWLVDKPNRAVHEFDISGLPHRAPVMIATVHVSG